MLGALCLMCSQDLATNSESRNSEFVVCLDLVLVVFSTKLLITQSSGELCQFSNFHYVLLKFSLTNVVKNS